MVIPLSTDTACDIKQLRRSDAGGYLAPARLERVYWRSLNQTHIRMLAAMIQYHDLNWLHLPTLLQERVPDIAHQGGEFNFAAHWGLMEEQQRVRFDGGRAGYWRATPLAKDFLNNFVSLPKYARIHRAVCLELLGEFVTAQDAVGENFNLAELLAA